MALLKSIGPIVGFQLFFIILIVVGFIRFRKPISGPLLSVGFIGLAICVWFFMLTTYMLRDLISFDSYVNLMSLLITPIGILMSVIIILMLLILGIVKRDHKHSGEFILIGGVGALIAFFVVMMSAPSWIHDPSKVNQSTQTNNQTTGPPGSGDLIWVQSAGSEFGYDQGNGITTLSDDSIIVTGEFHGVATFGPREPNQPNQTVLYSLGGSDIFIARYNPDGSLAWAKRAGGTSDYEAGKGITSLSDNSVVVTGWFTDTATFGWGEPNQTILTSGGDIDIFIARYNADGTLVWAKQAGGAKYDEGNGITTLSDDSTVVTGHFAESATFGPGEPNQTVLTSTGYGNIFIAQYNPDGTLAWVKHAGGPSFILGNAITTLSDNSTVVTGMFEISGTFGSGEPNETILTAARYKDVFIARYNPDGTLAWAKRAGGARYDEGNGITTLSDDSTVVTGHFAESATFGPGEPNMTVLDPSGIGDIFIARYNPDGTLAWAKRTGGAYNDYLYINEEWGYGITTLSDDSTVVTGMFAETATFGEGEPNQTVLTSADLSDIFIASYNPDGTLAWAKCAGGGYYDKGSGIATLSDDSIVVTGQIGESAIFGTGESNEVAPTSAGSDDIFIARFGP
ncbi:hypothetical protein KAU08_09570 [bacterium]|nr:hypothetical protein [bacterium]